MVSCIPKQDGTLMNKSSEKKSVCNVRMLVYKMQVRLRELLWSILMKQTV